MITPAPHPSRLDPSHPSYNAILAAHEQAVTRGATSYVDPLTGLTVLTHTAHIARGACCASGCRHCPFVDG